MIRKKSAIDDDIRISEPKKDWAKFRAIFGILVYNPYGPIDLSQKPALIQYFIDMDYYEKYEEQLMGIKYVKTNYGIFPCIDECFDKSGVMLKQLDSKKNHLNKREIDFVNFELNRFKNYTPNQMEELIKKDVPWIGTEEGDVIVYESVFYRTDDTSVRDYGDSD